VSPENIDPVIHTVGTGLGLQVQDHISARQIGRVMEEAGIASDIQVAMEINASKGVFSLLNLARGKNLIIHPTSCHYQRGWHQNTAHRLRSEARYVS
jgi:hypothetical protein